MARVPQQWEKNRHGSFDSPNANLAGAGEFKGIGKKICQDLSEFDFVSPEAFHLTLNDQGNILTPAINTEHPREFFQ